MGLGDFQIREGRSSDRHVRGSNRVFGLAFGMLFLIVALLPAWFDGPPLRWAIVFSALLFSAALFLPRSLALPNRAWGLLESRLQRALNAIIMFLLFFGFVTPMALLLRVTRRDLLHLRFDRVGESYWSPRRFPGPPPESLSKPF